MLFKTGRQTILAIPDLHCPFEHRDALAFLKAVEAKYEPDKIVCLGDEVDSYALSTYEHGPDTYSAGHELDRATEHLKPFYKAFPVVSVCTSNHTNRIVKKAFRAGLPAKFLKSFADILNAPSGWIWKDRWIYDNIVYEHGEGYSGAAAARLITKDNMKSTVFGHIHAYAGVQYLSNPYEQFFGMNCGCLVDEESYAFQYAKLMKNKPILGCGIVMNGVPYFIPMICNTNNRWIGRV
jgi:hypothetical protein